MNIEKSLRRFIVFLLPIIQYWAPSVSSLANKMRGRKERRSKRDPRHITKIQRK